MGRAARQISDAARVTARVTGLATLTVAQLGLVQLHQKISEESVRDEVFDRHARVWVRTLLRMFGVKISGCDSLVIPKATGGRLIVSNHRSPIDIALVLSLFGGHVLSRGDLSGWPILGTAARKAGTIFVDRQDSMSGARAVRQIRRYLQNGATVTVFPEGTTYSGDEVRDFMLGAFVGMKGLDVQVVPVGIAYEPGAEFCDETFVEHLKRCATRKTTRVGICVGQGQVLRGSTAQTACTMHDQVQQLVHRARETLERSD